MLSVYVLRFMTLGSKINSKFTNTSGLLTEQVRALVCCIQAFQHSFDCTYGLEHIWQGLLLCYSRFHGHCNHVVFCICIDQSVPPDGKSSAQERRVDNCKPCTQAGFKTSKGNVN